MTHKMIFTPPPEPAINTMEIWRNNALVAGGTVLATGIMLEVAQGVATAVMGSGAIADTIGFSAGSAVMLSCWDVEHRLAHTDGFSIRIGQIGGLAIACAVGHFCKYRTALAIGAVGAAWGTGRLAVEMKRLFPNGSPE